MRTRPYPHLFAHRGDRTLAPENTLSVIQEAIAQALGCKAIHYNYRLLNASIARTIKEQGQWLFCYTVNDPKIGSRLVQ